MSSCFIEYKIELLMYKSTPPEFVLELKNCSKKEPGFERCQCLEAMNESNVETVKVKYETVKGKLHINLLYRNVASLVTNQKRYQAREAASLQCKRANRPR